jgi:hypothetical protein
MDRSIFISKEAMGKLTVHSYTVTSIVWSEKISTPKSALMKIKSAQIKYGEENIKYLNE